ncbi:PEP/pyruvate-binding domain-containing protein [Magnetospirillum sulfuroxidans]|uniref:Phosphoenolpyruvate synthase n=1 Tax=Magnetospirillum sulfuroxidans TaxID=611300 RepID=A0ABS5IBK0_9PROT|nr:PEP/pyruvate-binding domain-containing protein [Magnetospirillum sulfuroxidans]MBR9971803.1 hypothetical protein [Magnetospirillum sulfuroxidans]
MDIIMCDVPQLASPLDVTRIGGKALHLFKLIEHGFPVPAFFSLTVEHAKEIELEQERILAAFDALNSPRVAVRSSGVDEDNAQASYAGMFETCLNVSRDTLIASIHKIFESKDTERVEGYRAEKAPQHSHPSSMGIVVQCLVNSDVSGVALTQFNTPADGAGLFAVIETCWGLGETLVQGLDTPERYIIDRRRLKGDGNDGAAIQRNLGNQLTMQVVAPKHGGHPVVNVPVPVHMRLRRRLSTQQVSMVTLMACSIEEKLFGGEPADIEFALANDVLFILQARRLASRGTPA